MQFSRKLFNDEQQKADVIGSAVHVCVGTTVVTMSSSIKLIILLFVPVYSHQLLDKCFIFKLLSKSWKCPLLVSY